jgi:hypothetical protein
MVASQLRREESRRSARLFAEGSSGGAEQGPRDQASLVAVSERGWKGLAGNPTPGRPGAGEGERSLPSVCSPAKGQTLLRATRRGIRGRLRGVDWNHVRLLRLTFDDREGRELAVALYGSLPSARLVPRMRAEGLRPSRCGAGTKGRRARPRRQRARERAAAVEPCRSRR